MNARGLFRRSHRAPCSEVVVVKVGRRRRKINEPTPVCVYLRNAKFPHPIRPSGTSDRNEMNRVCEMQTQMCPVCVCLVLHYIIQYTIYMSIAYCRCGCNTGSCVHHSTRHDKRRSQCQLTRMRMCGILYYSCVCMCDIVWFTFNIEMNWWGFRRYRILD